MSCEPAYQAGYIYPLTFTPCLSNLKDILRLIDHIQCKLEGYIDLLQLDEELEEDIHQREEYQDDPKDFPENMRDGYQLSAI